MCMHACVCGIVYMYEQYIMFLAYTQTQLVLCKNATSLQTKHIVMVFSGAASSEEVQPSCPLLGQHLLLSTLLSGTVWI